MHDMQPQGVPDAHARGHEPTDIRIGGVLTFFVALAALTAAALLVLGGFMKLFTRQERRLEAIRPALYSDERGQFPGPRLNDSPGYEPDKVVARSKDRSERDAYGWVDRKAGVARIPVDRAIEVLARKGLPTRKAAESKDGKKD